MTENAMEEEWLAQRRREILERRVTDLLSGRLAEFRDAQLEDIEGPPGEYLRPWVKTWPHPKHRNIILGGPTGAGKTHASVAVMRAAVNAGLTAHLVGYSEYLTALRPDGEVQHWRVRREAQEPWLLVIDDLGVELNAQASEAARREMVDLMTVRNGAQLVTVVTTNLKPEQVKFVFGERFFSRLSQDSAGLRMIRDDRRGQASW